MQVFNIWFLCCDIASCNALCRYSLHQQQEMSRCHSKDDSIYCCSWISLLPGHSQILSRSRGEKLGEGLGSKLRHRPEMLDLVVQTESTLRTNRVHHFQSVA